jgi:LmbE family N-acetylglucosaminyl deacetylase
MKFLFLCAHPDDLEFSVPSLMITISGNPDLNGLSKKIKENIIKAIDLGRNLIVRNPKNTNFSFKTACMTRGEMSPFSKEVGTLKAGKIRTIELKNSQKVLTGGTPDFLGFFDGYIRVTDKSISIIKDYIAKLQPDIIIAPEPWITWYHHPDHIRTGLIAYYALMRLINEKKNNKIDIKIPKLFYFQTLWNDWYFPKFPAYKILIDKARKAHKCQQGILGLAKVPEFIEIHSHIRKIPYLKSEGLRYQPLPNNPNMMNKNFRIKNLKNASIFKKIIISFFYYLIKHDRNEHYEKIYKEYYDGRLDPSISNNWFVSKKFL